MSAKKDISKEFDKISDGVKQVQKKRKSLTGRIFKWMCLAVGGSLLIVGGVNIGINYNFLQESLKSQLTEVADMSSNTVSNQVSSITAELLDTFKEPYADRCKDREYERQVFLCRNA